MAKYLVMSAYYKHGETMVKFYKSEESFREAMMEYLERFNESFTEGIETEDLVYQCLELGQRIIEQQRGYGIVHIARIVGEVTNYGDI